VSLRLAELDYSRRYYARAYNLLQFLSKQNLTSSQLLRWQDAQSRLLMSAGQFEQACEVLAGGEENLEALTEAENSDPLLMYMRFNFAICLIKTDEISRGWWLMERIGRITEAQEDLYALRDRANLLLGYNFLATAQGGLVKDVMRRVRLQGPFRTEALLALGWMNLASGEATPSSQKNLNKGQVANNDPGNGPAGQQDKRLKALEFNPFGDVKLGPGQSKQLNAALAAWQEAVKSFPLDAAAQEAIVAIAFATGRLGEKQAALSAYQRAVSALERSHQTLTGTAQISNLNLDQIAAGKLDALPNATWVTQTLAGNDFQEH
jgi:tetratricopeptide (TPR) repeat protein